MLGGRENLGITLGLLRAVDNFLDCSAAASDRLDRTSATTRVGNWH